MAKAYPILMAAALGLVALLAAEPAGAGSGTDNAAPFNLSRDLTFRVTYPRFLRFRVGATGGTTNLITFSPTVAQIGNGTPVAGTGGEAGGGSAANVEIVGNFGQITITPTNNGGGLGLGTGTAGDGYINYDQVQTASSSAQLPAPVLSNAGGTAVQPTLNTVLVTQRTAVWTYSYLNTTIPSAGTYGAGSGTGGRVTYTATMP
ncbi:MAG: hypothetical protein FIB05_02395 [Betaproteobacteria bacterium]|nr:hypothetical protein [Betaproteobacteria bacterium]PWB59544.1 MAG: hypothetical protein C3F16_11925 [Betaproteobacteria bacterium]